MFRKIHSPLSPWEVFQKIYARSKNCFFLDSVDYHPPDQRYSYLGCDPFLEVVLDHGKMSVRGEEAGDYPPAKLFPLLRRLFKKYRTRTRHDFFSGGAVGFFSYELVSLFERIHFRKKPGMGLPLLYLGFYRDLIVYDHEKRVYYAVGRPSPYPSLRLRGEGRVRGPFRLKNFRPEISRSDFKKMVLKAKAYIAQGDIYQANLSQRFRFDYEGSPLALYGRLRKINPSPFSSLLKIKNLEIISNSPERLIRKRSRQCETRPIAGTYPRHAPHVSPEGLEKALLKNEKERAEHIMLVDLERNDLGRVCEPPSVKVEEMMKAEHYSHVIHLVSKIVGRTAEGKDAFDLLQAMFPGGTITGCPKIHCMEIIDELEPTRRGIYTGSLGYLGFNGDLDLNIVIRTIVLQKNRGTFQVGAGIVHDSAPDREYEETLHKGEALAQALVEASLKKGDRYEQP